MLHTARSTFMPGRVSDLARTLGTAGVAAFASFAAACSDSTSPTTSSTPTMTQPSAPSAMVTPCSPRVCARIAYDFTPGGKAGGPTYVYSMNPDGSNKKQLAKGARPSWSPDHLKIAYVSYVNKYDIFTMNGDGSGVTQLTSSPSEDQDPSWSPDGKFIAFASNRGKTYDIWIMESNGANPVQLTTADDANESNPAWSPDGKRIAYSSISNVTGAWEVHIIDIATKVVTVPPVAVKKAYYPAWSPDGMRLAFASEQSVESCGIWILDMTSTATIAPFKGAGYGRCTHPSFSPDGKRLVFTNYYLDGSMIQSANVDGTNGYWGLTSGPPTVSSSPSWAFR